MSLPPRGQFEFDLSPEQAKEMKHNTEIKSLKDSSKIQNRMRELREMGFEDVPYEPGIRSSMRIYAESTLLLEESGDADEESAFATLDKHLLSRAEELGKRFKLRPVSPQEMFHLKAEKEASTIISDKTLNEVATVFANNLFVKLGIVPSDEELSKAVALIKVKISSGEW
jgi:hypothetical protein